ncbi:type 1 glutamine amidotransferase family protein [Bacillus carboniphilus]|uniref:Type 1 glutamine amidotransferase family protein n=1 Tax=Bacillus carboniphilus TaxID=86663 RepID=A0ABN0WHJ7_9BACI
MERRKALLLVFTGYCEFEVSVAISMLRGTHDLHTVSIDKNPCKSEAGLTTIPDYTIDEIDTREYDVIMIPGGDLKSIAEATKLFELVRSISENGKVVGAICSGVFVAAKAGILEDVPYTVTLSKQQREFLGSFPEETFHYSPTVKYQNILTAQGHAFVEFGIELNKMLTNVNESTVEFYLGKGNQMMEKGVGSSN